MATRYPDGTLESGMEQRDDTRDYDTVTNEGENQKNFCTDAMPTAKSEIMSEVDPLSGTIPVKYARETSANESVVHLHPSEPESGQEPSCDSGDSDTLVITDADEKVPISHDTQLEESKIEHKDASCDSGDSDTLVITDASEKVPISHDTQLEESKIEHKDASCDSGDNVTLSQTDGTGESLGLDYVRVDLTESGQEGSCDYDNSDNDSIMESKFIDPNPEENNLASSTHISDSTSLLPDEACAEYPEKAEENLLQGKLLSLNLSKEDINFLLEHGDKFLEKPPLLLARKLGIVDVEKAKTIIEALKSFKSEKTTNYISEDDQMLIEDCLKNNPEFSTPEDIVLLTDLPLQTIILYLQNRPLDDRQKADIKKKVNIGNSVKEIAAILNLSPNKVQEYVEKTFLTFTGVEGRRCWEIIHKNFGYSSILQLRKLIISNDLKLQDQLCYILLKQNERDRVALKKYFQKFEESKSFFEIKQTHLSIDDIHQINQSTDIEHLSIKLNKPATIIRDYLAQYKPNQVVMEQSETMQKVHIQELLVKYGTEQKLPFESYRMIVTHRFEDMMERAQTRQYPLQVFEELLPLAFYYLKCSLPFTEINQMFVSTGKSKLTTHELFHLIFQQSDPVLKAFCIEHYSFSNPVPFYYPNLHTANLNQFSVEFAICSELWYSIQQYNGLISFGLGRASWNPIGKSRLLDMIFETDFMRGNPQNSAFHSNSIDIQMTNNLFGEKTQEHADEFIKWAFIDCHGHSNRDLIRLICQQLDIALIQVCFQDFLNYKGTFKKQVTNLTNSVKHVYIFIRDYNGVEVKVDMTNSAYKLIYVPNLTKSETNIDSVKQSVRSIGYEMLHLNSESTKTLGNEFIEKVMDKIDGANLREIMVEKALIRKIIDCAKKSKMGFPFLHYYPLFVNYMSCYYQASNETDKNIIDRLNSESTILHTKLSNTKVGEVVKHFSRIIGRENSSLIMWRLSQMLAQFTNQVITEKNEQLANKYSLQILWREILLSSKFGKFNEEGREEFLQSFALSYSNHVERGEPFELIDGDNLRYFNQDIDSLLANMYQMRRHNLEVMNEGKDIKIKEAPIVVSIFGPQSSGKSTLLNYCFGCKFLTSTGRCTRGIYASLAQLSRPVNCSDQFLILDTEGLDAIGRGHNKDNTIIQFDRTMVLFCLAVSQVVIINVKGEIGREMQNLLHICAYSLNKLKVRRVTAPQIFFVLNQQADPNITNHLNDINILMEKLSNELVDTEGKSIIVSELIQVSPKNVFILPSAFNAENFNKHSLKLFDSKVIKLSPTTVFADKCADLRMAIIEKLDNMPVCERTSFETMSEWLEISGTIWDTIIKYQDIVKYGNVEEMMCSDLLRKIISELMNKHIYAHKQEFVERTEKVSSEIREMNILGKIDDTLRDILEDFGVFFQPYINSCLTAYKERCQTDTLLKGMNYLCKEYELNLTRLMYVQYMVYEDKIKFQISAVKIEKKIHESMKKFQEAIITNIDSYSKQSIEEQKSTFELTWADCFEDEDNCGEEVELNDTFERLYSLFKMELRAMENKTEILSTFRTENYQMENIIENIETEILVGFLGNTDVHGEKHFVFPIMENNVPLRAMTPFPTKQSYQYLAPDCLYRIVTDRTKRKTKIKLLNEVPNECKSLVKYCSGYYNYPDVQWKGWRMDRQIFYLVSLLKSPRNPQLVTWQLLIEDIATVKKFIDHDPTVSPGTIKEIINHLYSIFQIVNYELGFIQARMTNTAERMISKLVFAYAFESVWETKKQNRLEHDLKKEEEKNALLQYFIQKIEVRKMFRGNMDREAMKMTDLKFSEKYARDLLGAVKRGVISAEQPSIENSYNERKGELSHKTLLLCGTAKVSVELNNTLD